MGGSNEKCKNSVNFDWVGGLQMFCVRHTPDHNNQIHWRISTENILVKNAVKQHKAI